MNRKYSTILYKSFGFVFTFALACVLSLSVGFSADKAKVFAAAKEAEGAEALDAQAVSDVSEDAGTVNIDGASADAGLTGMLNTGNAPEAIASDIDAADTADKVSHSSTVAAARTKVKKIRKKDLRLMASIIYCEACGESYQGKLAVGIVIKNRMRSKLFPDTLKGVIYQPYQFAPVRNGYLNKRLSEYDNGKTDDTMWKDSIKAAKEVLSGHDYIMYKGHKKNFRSYNFFSRYLSGSRLKLGHHNFK